MILLTFPESHKSSPRLPTKSRSPQPRDTPRESSQRHEIVVVAEGNTQVQQDSELQKLENIPVFVPIMRGTLNIPNIQEPEMLERLDSRYKIAL